MAVRDDFAPGEVLTATDLNDTFGSKLDLAGGKILQIVRATDTTQRSTTSTTYVDVTGMSVTITPQKSDSAIIVIASVFVDIASGTVNNASVAITDSSNNLLSGAERAQVANPDNISSVVTILGYSTPSTTSATTYKLRFRLITSNGQTVFVQNALHTGQMYAMEVSA